MRKRFAWMGGLAVGLLGFAQNVFADAAAAAAPTIDKGDTAWMIVATALVLLMTPGLALFYGGMVRSKNILSTMMHSFILMGIISITWSMWGYSNAFGHDIKGLCGGWDFIFLKGVGEAPGAAAATIPHSIFMLFQMMFAIITVALITGSIAERVKFGAMVLFSILWATVIYNPLAHWVWGGGWLMTLGALDFAGGTVVHISSGVSALAFALVLGKRKAFQKEPIVPNNLPLTVLGAGLLWFGWYGFNAGSALNTSGLSCNAFLVTHLAAAAGTLGWAIGEKLARGKASVLGAASGCVAGLVAITPASGFVSAMPAILLGFVAGWLCFYSVQLKNKLGYDDALDVFGVHGVGGTWGAIATGLFASKVVNPAGADGLFYGGGVTLLTKQFIAIGATMALAFIGTLIICKIVDVVIGLRVSESAEEEGLDISQHGEEAYNL